MILDDPKAAKALRAWLDSGQREAQINYTAPDGTIQTVKASRPGPSTATWDVPSGPGGKLPQIVKFALSPLRDTWAFVAGIVALVILWAINLGFLLTTWVGLVGGVLMPVWALVGLWTLAMLLDAPYQPLTKKQRWNVIKAMHLIYVIGLVGAGLFVRAKFN